MSKYVLRGVYILALAVTVVNLLFSVKNYLFPDIGDLPEGTLKTTAVSPSGKQKVNVYRVDNRVGSGVRAELVDASGSARNIFWQTDLENVDIRWDHEEIITFNGVPVSAEPDGAPYDCRRGISLFTDGALAEGLFKESKGK